MAASNEAQTRSPLTSKTLIGAGVLVIGFAAQLAVMFGWLSTDEAAALNAKAAEGMGFLADIVGLFLVVLGRLDPNIKPIIAPGTPSDGNNLVKTLFAIMLLGAVSLGTSACVSTVMGPDGQPVPVSPLEQKRVALLSVEKGFTAVVDELNFLSRAGALTPEARAKAVQVVLSVNSAIEQAHGMIELGNLETVDALLDAAQRGIRELIIIKQQAETK